MRTEILASRLAGVVGAIKVAAAVTAAAVMLGAMLFSGRAAHAVATCSDSPLGIDQHGDHVVRDYVIGQDGTGPAHEGAEVPGGPGPGFHFIAPPPGPYAPGASFCLLQAHPRGFTPPKNVPSPGRP